MENCINNTFGALTQPFILKTITKKNTSFLALIMFHGMSATKPKKYFRVLSCIIFIIIDNCIYIDFLACQSKQLHAIFMYSKYMEKDSNRILGIGIPDLLMNLFSFHDFSKNIKSIVVIKYRRRMLEYYFWKDLVFWYAIQII